MNNSQMNNESMYRDRASRTSTQLGTDLQLDDEKQTQAEEIYFDRAQRRADLQQRYSTDTTGMASEMRNIDTETDRQFRDILTDDQYRTYEEGRENYADRDNYELNRSETNRQGGLDAGTGTGTRTETQTQGTGGDDQRINAIDRGTQPGTQTETSGTGAKTQETGTNDHPRSGHQEASPSSRPQYEVYTGSDGTNPSTSSSEKTNSSTQKNP